MQLEFETLYKRRRLEAHADEVLADTKISKIIIRTWIFVVTMILMYILY